MRGHTRRIVLARADLRELDLNLSPMKASGRVHNHEPSVTDPPCRPLAVRFFVLVRTGSWRRRYLGDTRKSPSLRYVMTADHLRRLVDTTVSPRAPLFLNPFRTAVPFWGQSTQSSSSLSPKRDCGSKRGCAFASCSAGDRAGEQNRAHVRVT